MSDYFLSPEDYPVEEQLYEYRICEFCLTPPCNDCLPYDFITFKASEIPVFFPKAVEDKDGVLDVHKHPHCRCKLFPVSGYVLEGELDMDKDVQDKIQAIRNHRLAFREEEADALYKIRLNEVVKEDEIADKVTQKKDKKEEEKSAFKRKNEDKQQQTLFKKLFTDTEAEPVKKSKRVAEEKKEPKTAQMQFALSPEGELKLQKKIEISADKQVVLFQRKNEAELVRQLYSFRSPQAMMRAGMREGMNFADEAGLLKGAAGMGAAATPLVFFALMPYLESLVKLYYDRYAAQQQKNEQAKFDAKRSEAYRTALRGIIPA